MLALNGPQLLSGKIKIPKSGGGERRCQGRLQSKIVEIGNPVPNLYAERTQRCRLLQSTEFGTLLDVARQSVIDART